MLPKNPKDGEENQKRTLNYQTFEKGSKQQ